MLYQSTRGGAKKFTAAEIIVRGMSEDGGLFVPESFPALTENILSDLASKTYKDRAARILGMFLDDFSAEELDEYAAEAYCEPGFDDPSVAPLYDLDGRTSFLELWHGPTCAFKDMALGILPRLLTASLRKTNEAREVCILVATSGDTGKAALQGFRDVPGTKIMVFYPRDGVSEVQKLQMTTQNGDNVNVVAVEGNFDDAQTGVKAIFADESLRRELSDGGVFLSSANSINWGRLVPQIAYYVSAYCDLASSGAIKPGERINFCVPTGNFGNILAAYYAERMGLPVGRLICASNRNDVLAQFIGTGVYDRNRPFYTTASPSMDIVVSSNLERLLFETSGKDGDAVAAYMKALSGSGRYAVSGAIRDEIRRVFSGGFCSEEDTMRTIADVYYEYKYLIDTHTAVGYKVLRDYREDTGDDAVSVVVATASPFKFCESVLEALGRRGGAGATACADDTAADDSAAAGTAVALLDKLAGLTGLEVPVPLAGLHGKERRFLRTVPPDGMKEAVREFVFHNR